MVLEFLNRNNGAITVIFSGLVAIATIVYAVLTWRLVSETKKMREVQTEPNISITVQPTKIWINFVEMIIENVGQGSAYNLTFKITPDFEYEKGKYLSQMSLMNKGMKNLSPNQKTRFFLTSLVENFEEKTKTPFDINITYNNSSGKKFKYSYSVDFSEWSDMTQIGEEPLHKIAKNVEEIKKDINHLTTGFYRIQTIVYTKDDIEEERHKKEEMRQKRMNERKNK